MRIECGWYTDKSGGVLGTILHNSATDDWGYAVCTADGFGEFRCVALQHGLQTEGKARIKTLAEMRRLAQTADSTVFRRSQPN